jgi:pimeloyl-ACP methyl ester carboxylesterase
MGVSRCVAVPGFADTPVYWAGLFERFGPVTSVFWPGLWGEPMSAGDPVADVVDAAAEVASGALLVAHSAGARVAVRVAGRVGPAGVVLLAPALGPLSFLEPAARGVWERSGVRPTTRPDPMSGVPVTLDVPVSYVAPLAMPVMSLPVCPTLMVLMSADSRQNVAAAQLAEASGSAVTVVEVDGPHRWWEDPVVAEVVLETVCRWMQS